MLEHQIECFESRKRLLELLLGCLSVGERVEHVLRIAGDPAHGPNARRATNVLLGLISFHHTLLAVSGADIASAAEGAGVGASPTPEPERGMLR